MKTHKTVNIQSVPGGIGIGVLTSILVTLTGVGILAWLLSGEHLQENALGYGTVIILLLSSVIGAGVAVMIVEGKRLVTSLLAGIGYFLVLLSCTALLFGGQYQRIGVTALVILAGSVSAALTGLKTSKTHTVTRHKYRNR